jgi:hypothetical protein
LFNRVVSLFFLLLIGHLPAASSQGLLFRTYFPAVQRTIPSPSEQEPNNSRVQANGPLEFGLTYYGLKNSALDTYDIFFFETTQPHTVRITLDNPPFDTMQIQLHNTTSVLPLRFDYQPPFQIDYTLTQAGKYYVVVYIPAELQSFMIYQLKVVIP